MIGYIVVPCYNEEAVLRESAARLKDAVQGMVERGKLSAGSRIIFVDDGSRDKTWEIIQSLTESEWFGGIKLSRNEGHQNALWAGLMTVYQEADFVISIDADLQDDVGAIERFVDEHRKGFDIVYGVRSSRKKDTIFKRGSAEFFYKLMRRMGAEIVFNHADYRLMSRRALAALAEFREVNLFLRGMVPLVGFSSSIVTYERQERFAGESKYPLKKMIKFALDGITSFSVSPLRITTVLGIFCSAASLIALIYALISKLFGVTVSGWTSILISIWLLGGLQLLAIGLIGEYIGKIYTEVKARPKYIIEEKIKTER